MPASNHLPTWVLEKIEREQIARDKLRAAFGDAARPPTRREIHDHWESILRRLEDNHERNPPPF